MSIEQKPGNNLERIAWRGTGLGIALGAVRLLATLPQPKTESDALEMIGLGLLIPTWALWGEARGWVKEDFSKLANFITRKDE